LPTFAPTHPGDAPAGRTPEVGRHPTRDAQPRAAQPHAIPLPPTPPPGGDTGLQHQPMDVAPPIYPYFLRKRTAPSISPCPDRAKHLRIDCLAFANTWFHPSIQHNINSHAVTHPPATPDATIPLADSGHPTHSLPSHSNTGSDPHAVKDGWTGFQLIYQSLIMILQHYPGK
jgi:hypothetical protein